MNAHCIPFSEIPHTTRLFLDYLAYTPAVRRFYPYSPRFADWFAEASPQIRYDTDRREQVAAILDRQNQRWGASARTLDNIARLRRGASAAVTGQQVGLFGGPVFSIYKALTAVRLAEQATTAGVECVPIFWLATEDHDLAEVNHVSIPGSNFAPERLEVASHGSPDAPVGAITFGPEIESVMQQAAELLGPSEAADILRDCYRPGENFGSAFARLFTSLFADWGVILLDASDPKFHRIAEPMYRAAIERAGDLDAALLALGKELESSGYHQQVKVTPSSTLLFTFREGARVPIHRRPNGPAEFLIAQEKISQSELLQGIAAAPHQFSANVLLRPVVQDYLLPTLAYSGGAAEIAYFAQAAVVYEALLGRTTGIVPRFSATLVEQKLQAILERYSVSPPELFQGPDAVRELLATRALPNDLQSAFDHAEVSLQRSLDGLRDALARLDPTLIEASQRARAKMEYQLRRLRSRAARAELIKSDILERHARLLNDALYPHKTLQEREIAGIYFVARYGRDLLQQLYETVNPDCLDHQIVEM